MAARPEVAAFAREAHEQEFARAQQAETKASRLLQTSLGLLALALTVAGFQANVAHRLGGGWSYLLVLPAGASIACLALAAIDALEIDRPGLYSPGTPEEVARSDDPVRAQTIAEERGRCFAEWTATHKYDTFLQARAWFSRSLVLLMAAGVVAVITQAIH